MAGSATLTICIAPSVRKGVEGLAFTTWGVTGGKYGSLGSVFVPGEAVVQVDSKSELARVVLTALYGLDYDL